MDIFFILSGLFLLILGSHFLTKGAISLSLFFKIPKIVVGLTIVSLATSTPELFISVQSVLNGHDDLAFGNIIGSNISNIGLIIGITTIIATLTIDRQFCRVELTFMKAISLLLFLFVVFDNKLNRIEGGILAILFIVFMIYIIKNKRNSAKLDLGVKQKQTFNFIYLLLIILGGVFLWLGAELLINGAISLAEKLGVDERIISITTLAIGTSLPELFASIFSLIKKEKGISIGNLIGSNIFNILIVLGVTSLIKPITIQNSNLIFTDMIWMLGFTFAIIPLVYFFSRKKLGYIEGLILLLGYIIFIYTLLF